MNAERRSRAPFAGRRFVLALLALGLVLGAWSQAADASRIAFVKGGRFDFVSPTGVPRGSLRADSFVVDFAASDDGRHFATLIWTATAGAHGDYYKIYVRTLGRRRPQQVYIRGPLQSPRVPSLALSPHGRLLAFSISPYIRIVDLATDRRRILRRVPHGFDVQPSFTADGRRLVFSHASYGHGLEADVYSIGLRGGRAHRLTTTSREEEFFPELSPDGGHLAFLHRDRSGFELAVCRRDGSGERDLRRVPELVSRPDFSPDGRRLVFATVRGNEYFPYPFWKLHTIGIGGQRERTLLRVRRGPLLPQWTRVP